MTKFYYVYLLVDIATETHRYTGVTEDLQTRFAKHNAGEVPRTHQNSSRGVFKLRSPLTTKKKLLLLRTI